MRILRIALLSAFVGGLAGAFVQRILPAAPRNPRKPETLSPTLARDLAENKSLFDYSRPQLDSYLDALTHELIRPDLSDVEADRVADQIKGLVVLAIQYNEFRASIEEAERDAQVDNWINQVGGNGE